MGDDGVPFVFGVSGKAGSLIAEGLVLVDESQANLEVAVNTLSKAFRELRKVGNYKLTELTPSLEIGAKGGVNFIGATKVSESCSITLTFSPAVLGA